MAYVKQTWVDNSSIVDADKLNHIEDGIYENSLSNDYSTSEINTGKTWIDGKPIYRKCFTGTTPTSGSVSKSIGTISNVETLIILTGMVHSPSYGYIPIPFNIDTGNNNKLYLTSSGNVTVENTNSAYQNKDVIAIAEYTKSS